jgi:hypothetical protein
MMGANNVGKMPEKSSKRRGKMEGGENWRRAAGTSFWDGLIWICVIEED